MFNEGCKTERIKNRKNSVMMEIKIEGRKGEEIKNTMKKKRLP